MRLKETIAKTFFIPPCPSSLLLTIKQLNLMCARSDIPGCATRKLKIQQYYKTECTQIITMSRVSQKILVLTNFNFFPSKLSESGMVNRRKEKRKKLETMTRR